jgi:membrane protein implicated in regulation of membrane protease activity
VIWKNRKKPFLFIEVILALTATILGVINLIRWNTDLPLMSFLIFILVGVVFTLRGVESRLNKEKGYKINIGFGLIICIIPILTFIIKYL